MSESTAGFFVGFIVALTLIIVTGSSPKQINEEWKKKLIQKGLGEYVVETVNDKPIVKFQFKDK